jgi:hypothetical protein
VGTRLAAACAQRAAAAAAQRRASTPAAVATPRAAATWVPPPPYEGPSARDREVFAALMQTEPPALQVRCLCVASRRQNGYSRCGCLRAPLPLLPPAARVARRRHLPLRPASPLPR